MADGSKIEWTDATWNPITGCSVATPGCTNCYAMKLAGTRMRNHKSRAGLTVDTKSGPVWNGEVRFNEEWLDQPLRWKRPRDIFVCAHGDLFHPNAQTIWIDRILAVMARAPQHRFQVLTKRDDRMQEYAQGAHACGEHWLAHVDGAPIAQWPLPNVWMGVSVEDADRMYRIDRLRETPAAVRWISAEPLLGSLKGIDLTGIHWVVSGGESGSKARPSHPDWHRELRDACAAADVPYHFKQWGEWVPAQPWYPSHPVSLPLLGWGDGGWSNASHVLIDDPDYVARLGKKASGRLLDGVTHDGIPAAEAWRVQQREGR